MPPGQTVKPTARSSYQLVPVIGPSAGMDLRTAPTLMPHDRAQLLVNWSLSQPGALVVRSGFDAFSTGSLGAGAFQGLARVYFNTTLPAPVSTAVTVVGWNGGVYVQTDSGGWLSTTPGLSGLSTSGLMNFPSDRNLVAVFDGNSTAPMKSTNGSSWTRFGIAPGTTATLSSLSTGGLSAGEYEVGFTYKDRDLVTESNGPATPSTITITASSGAISVQIPNSTDPQVEAIKVYARKVSAGETVRRYVSSLVQSGGATTTYVLTSTTWTSGDEEPSDHALPPALAFGVVWKNRWWARHATITNRIHFSQLFQPQSWPGLFYIDIPFERGDSILALLPLGDTLLIFGNTKIFVILGQTSLDFEVRPTIASQDGALGPRAVAVLENGVVHAGASGVYIFDGTNDRLLSYDIDPAWRDLVENTGGATLQRIAIAYHQKEKELRIAVPRRYPSGTVGEWVLDLNRTRTTQQPAWCCTDRTIDGYLQWDGPETTAGNRGRLFSGHSSMAQVFEDDVAGAGANSSNLTATYLGPGLSLGSFRGRWIDIYGEYEPHAGSFSVQPNVDGLNFPPQGVTIAGGGAVYGTAVYGTATYAGGVSRKQFYRMFPLAADGRSLVMSATYVGQEAFRIYTYHVGVVPENHQRQFSE